MTDKEFDLIKKIKFQLTVEEIKELIENEHVK